VAAKYINQICPFGGRAAHLREQADMFWEHACKAKYQINEFELQTCFWTSLEAFKMGEK